MGVSLLSLRVTLIVLLVGVVNPVTSQFWYRAPTTDCTIGLNPCYCASVFPNSRFRCSSGALGISSVTALQCLQQCSENSNCVYADVGFVQNFDLNSAAQCRLFSAACGTCTAYNLNNYKYAKEACPSNAAAAACKSNEYWSAAMCTGFSNGCTGCTLCAKDWGYNGAGGAPCTATSNGVCGPCKPGYERPVASEDPYLCQPRQCLANSNLDPTVMGSCPLGYFQDKSCDLRCLPGHLAEPLGATTATCTLQGGNMEWKIDFYCIDAPQCFLTNYIHDHAGMAWGNCIEPLEATEVCQISCFGGFSLEGNANVTCSAVDGTVSGTGVCTPGNACEDPNSCDLTRSECVPDPTNPVSWTCVCRDGYLSVGNKCLAHTAVAIDQVYGPGLHCSPPLTVSDTRTIQVCNGAGQVGNRFELNEQSLEGLSLRSFRRHNDSVFGFNLIVKPIEPNNPTASVLPAGEYVYVDLCDSSNAFNSHDEFGIWLSDPQNATGFDGFGESTQICRDYGISNLDLLFAPTSPYVISFLTKQIFVNDVLTAIRCWRVPICFVNTETRPIPQAAVFGFGPIEMAECRGPSYCSRFKAPGDEGCFDPDVNTWRDVQCTCRANYEGDGVFCEPKRCRAQPRDVVGALGVSPQDCTPSLGVESGKFCNLSCDVGFTPSGGKYQCWFGQWLQVDQGWTDPEPPPEPTARLQCIDHNECAVTNGGSQGHLCSRRATCTNIPGSYSCQCLKGFWGDGRVCQNINECQTNNGGCSANAHCVDMEGTFSCGCKAGYVGDGTHCSDVNECAVDPASCDANARCFNTDGSFRCSCNEGFYSETNEAGVLTCVQIDVCVRTANSTVGGCDTNAYCANKTCFCNDGWLGDGHACYECLQCTDSWFETSPCSPKQNTQCAACTVCDNTTQEVVPCTSHQERICLEDVHVFEIHNETGETPIFDIVRDRLDPSSPAGTASVHVVYGAAPIFDPSMGMQRVFVVTAPTATIDTSAADNLFYTVSSPFTIQRKDKNGAFVNGRFDKGDYVLVEVAGYDEWQDIHLMYNVGGLWLDASSICSQVNPEWGLPATPATDATTNPPPAAPAAPLLLEQQPLRSRRTQPPKRISKEYHVLEQVLTEHVQAQQQKLPTYNPRPGSMEEPVTNAYMLLESSSHSSTSRIRQRRQRTQQHSQEQRRERRERQEEEQALHELESMLSGVSALVTKEFRVCYTRNTTTFVLATPVPAVQNFTCEQRLFDSPQFFTALTSKSRLIRCPEGCLTGKIYGSNKYTVDSATCTAAAHATQTDGGVFEITLIHDPSEQYPSFTREVGGFDVRSNAYPHSYPTAFTVVQAGLKVKS